MNKRNLLAIGGIAALGLALVALPASSARPQKPDVSTIARLQQRIDELEAKLQAQAERRQDQEVELADTEELEDPAPAFIVGKQDPAQIEVLPGIDKDDLNIVIGDDGSGWLGVETHEVTASWERLFLTAPRQRPA